MIVTISERERGRAVSTITLAFALDPVIRWMYPDADDYLRLWPRFVEAYGGGSIDSGAAHATEDFSGVWLPPGVSPDEDGVLETLHAGARDARGPEVHAALEEMDAYRLDASEVADAARASLSRSGGTSAGLVAHGGDIGHREQRAKRWAVARAGRNGWLCAATRRA